MLWIIGGYMWLFIHRPFEYYPVLGLLQIERIYMILMFLAWLVYPHKRWPSNLTHAAIALFTMVTLASWVLSPYAEQTQDAAENYLKVLVFYIILVTTMRDEASVRFLLTCYLASVGLYMAHSFLEYLNGRMEWRMGISRMVGVDLTFNNPNAFASTMLYSLPMSLPLWAEKRGTGFRALLLGFNGLAALCILLTGSRAGFVGLCAYSLLALVTYRGNKGLIVVVLVACVLICTALPGPLQNRFLTLIDPSVGPANAQQSAEGRWQGFAAGALAWSNNPLLGWGPTAFPFATGRAGHAHNLYGQLLAELGTLGVLAFLALQVCYWRNVGVVRRYYRRRPAEARDFSFYLGRAVTMNLLLMLLVGWSGHTLFHYYWLWLGAFQVGLVSCVKPASVPAVARHWGGARLAVGALR
jgi:O-antigen ligase